MHSSPITKQQRTLHYQKRQRIPQSRVRERERERLTEDSPKQGEA
jgi:hypothetical protein